MRTSKSIKLNVLNKNEMSSIQGGDSGWWIFCTCPCCCCCDENTNKSVQRAKENANTCKCDDKATTHQPPENPCQ